jgi:signal transduction histidine kinase
MAERERLEGEILKVSEREQRRIGHDLHDSLCQHLTVTHLYRIAQEAASG